MSVERVRLSFRAALWVRLEESLFTGKVGFLTTLLYSPGE